MKTPTTDSHSIVAHDINNHCCVGKEALVIYDYDCPVKFSGYDPQLRSRDFKKVLAVLEYTNLLTGQIYHLVIHQAIHIPNLDHHLLCPMQC